jgi:methionyl-tRNA formyltransferase
MRILIFGDLIGIPQLLRWVPAEHICGLVVASIRPQNHNAIMNIAEKMNFPFLIQTLPSSNNYKEFTKRVEDLEPELIWVNSYSMIVRNDVLNIPKLGGINIHGALLPQYRGCNPTEWAIINGEHETGVTLHEMSSEIDEGNIIAQKKVPLYYADTWRDATDRVLEATDLLINENLELIIKGEWSSLPQDVRSARYHRRRYFADGSFQWNQSVYEIYNLVRALVAPHPGASYIRLNGVIEVIDSYKTPAEISLMKFQELSGLYISSNHLQIYPLSTADLKIPFTFGDYKDKTALKKLLDIICPLDSAALFKLLKNTQIDQINFLIGDIKKHKLIGLGILSQIDMIEKKANLRVELLLGYKDLISEAITLLKKFGVEELNLQKFTFIVNKIYGKK